MMKESKNKIYRPQLKGADFPFCEVKRVSIGNPSIQIETLKGGDEGKKISSIQIPCAVVVFNMKS